MANFGVVDQAVKSAHTVNDYIKVGMDIVNEVAVDVIENKQGSRQDDPEKDIVGFRKKMLNFVKMEQTINHLQQAVEYVKQEHMNHDKSMEELLDEKLAMLRAESDDQELLQHERIQDFNQKIWETLHPEEAYSAAEFGFPPNQGDAEVEMTQETVNTKCPYTGQEMVLPVRNIHCGHSYDKDGIMQYVSQRKNKAKCPLSGCTNDKPIVPADLEDNKELKRYIDHLRKNAKKGRK